MRQAESTSPLPAALPHFATGPGALGLLGWRRKRKATAADENVPGRCFRSDETKPIYRAASDSDGGINCDHRQRQLFDQH